MRCRGGPSLRSGHALARFARRSRRRRLRPFGLRSLPREPGARATPFLYRAYAEVVQANSGRGARSALGLQRTDQLRLSRPNTRVTALLPPKTAPPGRRARASPKMPTSSGDLRPAAPGPLRARRPGDGSSENAHPRAPGERRAKKHDQSLSTKQYVQRLLPDQTPTG